MVEAVDNVVKMDDLSPSVMEIILDFIYGRAVSIPADHAVAVFEASDRLNLPDLTTVVIGILKNDIQCETITDVLHIAGNYMNDELWTACVDYAKANTHNLRRTPSTPLSLSLTPCDSRSHRKPPLLAIYEIQCRIGPTISTRHLGT